MKYPSVSEDDASLYSRRLIEGIKIPLKVKVKGAGEDFDEQGVNNLTVVLRRELEVWKGGKDAFEGRIATRIHQELKDIPIPVLDDPSFWRYLSLKYFWWYAEWRESGSFKIGGNYMAYTNAKNPNNSIPLRIYLRGQIAAQAGDENLCTATHQSTDFWRSHITRVKNWRYPSIAKAFIETHAENHMKTSPLREFAKSLGRRRANIVFTHYTDKEASDVVEDLRSSIPEE
jgi:hypothetical protein